MSHGAPLNAVIGWSRMLRSGRLDSESAAHALAVIERNAWAQKQIIEDILDVSRVITGKLQLTLGPVDLVAIVDALDAVRPALEAKDQNQTTIDAGLRIISGDADRLQQVVEPPLRHRKVQLLGAGRSTCRSVATILMCKFRCAIPGRGRPRLLAACVRKISPSRRIDHEDPWWPGPRSGDRAHLVELHGGVITAENRTDGSGAIFSVKLRLPSGELRKETLASALNAFAEPESEPVRLDGLTDPNRR